MIELKEQIFSFYSYNYFPIVYLYCICGAEAACATVYNQQFMIFQVIFVVHVVMTV